MAIDSAVLRARLARAPFRFRSRLRWTLMVHGDQEKALDRLAETLDAIDEHLVVADARVKRTEKFRLSMLHLHAVAAMFIAPLFTLLGTEGMRGPTWVVARLIPGAPYSLGLLLFAGGVILAVSTYHRAIEWELVGLWILLFWYATISISFAAAVFVWLYHGSPQGPMKPSTYPGAVYLHLCLIMLRHILTLRKLRRLKRGQK